VRRRELVLLLGGAMTAAGALRAQQRAMPVIGYLNGTSPDASAALVAAFRQGLSETGWVEEQNVRIEYRWAEFHFDRLPALAADLVGRKVALIAACGGAGEALAAKHATSTIPIVFTIGDDPVANGLVASLARPGGNLTGVALLNVLLMQKRLDLVSQLVPGVRLIALLVNSNNPVVGGIIQSAQEAAGGKGLQLQVLRAGTEAEIDAAFATLVRLHAGALIIADVLFDSRSAHLAALSAHYKVPAIGLWRKYVVDGGLISYGVKLATALHQVGLYAGKILNGARPADLPVQQPAKFELVINLKTAKVLGLTVPPSILARADEVIE